MIDNLRSGGLGLFLGGRGGLGVPEVYFWIPRHFPTVVCPRGESALESEMKFGRALPIDEIYRLTFARRR